MESNIIINESISSLRALGRDSLKYRWGFAALGTLLYAALLLVPVIILNALFGPGDNTTSGVGTLYSFLVTGPMTLGYTMFGISIFRRRETSVAEVFYGFERFGKSLRLYIVMSFFILLWTLLFIIPGIIASFRYSLCFFILADNPNMGIMEALKESKRMMKGNKWKMFCLNISFIGWGILCILTAGIGFLWLTPYIQVSVTAFYEMANGSLKMNRIEREYIADIKKQNPLEDPITEYIEEPNQYNKQEPNQDNKQEPNQDDKEESNQDNHIEPSER